LKTRGDRSPVIPELVLPTLEELGLEFSKIDSRAAIQFKGGETEAMKTKPLFFRNKKTF
jgi:deoxyribodipyrimidine photo-lyase